MCTAKRTGYIYRLEKVDGTIKTDTSFSNTQIQFIDKTNIKSIHCICAVTGRSVDSWERNCGGRNHNDN